MQIRALLPETVRVVGLLALLTAMGCSTAHVHRSLGTGPDHREIFSAIPAAGKFPAPYNHIRVGRSQVNDTGAGGEQDATTVYEFPESAFDEALAAILLETGGFDSVEVAAAEGKLLGSGSTGVAGLVLTMEVNAPSLTFQNREEWGWGVGGWLIGIGVPTWWFHDEVYRLRFDGRAILTDPRTGATVGEVALGECYAEDSLNFFERNDSILPYLITAFVPPTVVASQPEALVESLLPVALASGIGPMIEAIENLEPGEVTSAGRDTSEPREPPAGRGIVIDLPDSSAVKFVFRSPRPGQVVTGDELDLEFQLVFPRDSRDLAQVEVNGEVVLPEEEGQPLPVKKQIPVEVSGVAFSAGEIVIAVTLVSKMDTIEAKIRRP